MPTTPRLSHVSTRPYIDPDTQRATSALVVEPVWQGVDRPNTGGWVVKDRTTAKRLEACIRDGNCFSSTRLAVDVNGQTYVATTALVMAKYMNADLRRLGY